MQFVLSLDWKLTYPSRVFVKNFLHMHAHMHTMMHPYTSESHSYCHPTTSRAVCAPFKFCTGKSSCCPGPMESGYKPRILSYANTHTHTLDSTDPEEPLLGPSKLCIKCLYSAGCWLARSATLVSSTQATTISYITKGQSIVHSHSTLQSIVMMTKA